MKKIVPYIPLISLSLVVIGGVAGTYWQVKANTEKLKEHEKLLDQKCHKIRCDYMEEKINSNKDDIAASKNNRGN